MMEEMALMEQEAQLVRVNDNGCLNQSVHNMECLYCSKLYYYIYIWSKSNHKA